MIKISDRMSQLLYGRKLAKFISANTGLHRVKAYLAPGDINHYAIHASKYDTFNKWIEERRRDYTVLYNGPDQDGNLVSLAIHILEP